MALVLPSHAGIVAFSVVLSRCWLSSSAMAAAVASPMALVSPPTASVAWLSRPSPMPMPTPLATPPAPAFWMPVILFRRRSRSDSALDAPVMPNPTRT
jgi:hypothetical protein